MKFSWIILLLILICGCEIKEEITKRKQLRESCSISESFYLLTVLHDEHLFIIRQNCGLIHHPNCPCFKNMPVEKPSEIHPPIIFINPIK